MNDTPNQKNKHPLVKALIGLLIGLVVAGVILLYGNRIVDAVLATRFVPNSQIASIRTTLQMTDEGNNLFYASQPVIESGEAFNTACETTERSQAILGCYTMRKIYLFDITNDDLAGAEEVTAAHEVLHAAYERLNIFERPKVDKMLDDQYQKIKDKPDLVKIVAYYRQNEPDSVGNELHSILGTIEASLSPELEAYYARYFTDRSAIVAMNDTYSAVFDAVNARATELADQIAAMKPQVEQALSQYTADLDTLNADIATFNQQYEAGVYKTQSAFNAARQALVVRVNALNARRNEINTTVAAYNAIIAEQNQLSVQVQTLNTSINAAPEAGGI